MQIEGFQVIEFKTMATRMKHGPEYRKNGDIYAEAVK